MIEFSKGIEWWSRGWDDRYKNKPREFPKDEDKNYEQDWLDGWDKADALLLALDPHANKFVDNNLEMYTVADEDGNIIG